MDEIAGRLLIAAGIERRSVNEMTPKQAKSVYLAAGLTITERSAIEMTTRTEGERYTVEGLAKMFNEPPYKIEELIIRGYDKLRRAYKSF